MIAPILGSFAGQRSPAVFIAVDGVSIYYTTDGTTSIRIQEY
jgi:hypothetical protein